MLNRTKRGPNVDITEEFTVDRPIGEVWTLFLDVPDVARCLPGAEVTEDHGDGTYSGTVAVKLGPISSTFEGTATVVADAAKHQMEIKGKGVDRKGGSQCGERRAEPLRSRCRQNRLHHARKPEAERSTTPSTQS